MKKFTSEGLLRKELEICQEALNNSFKLNANLQLEIERLKLAQPEEVTKCCIDCINRIKSEARKEFAERLKEKFPSNSHWVKPKEMVDNLLKEMEGK